MMICKGEGMTDHNEEWVIEKSQNIEWKGRKKRLGYQAYSQIVSRMRLISV